MKTAVFYENIRDGADALGLDLEEVTAELMDAGMEMLYLSPDSWKRDSAVLKPLLENFPSPSKAFTSILISRRTRTARSTGTPLTSPSHLRRITC